MPRIRRMINQYEPTIYHVMSRTALDGYPLTDVDKDYLVSLVRSFSQLYLVDVIGFCIMDNHFHLMIRVYPEGHFSDNEMLTRLKRFYGKKKLITKHHLPFYRSKLSSLSEYVKEIKQGFTRYYNKLNNRKGFFWGQRFKSVMIENSEALLNCLAYIDLNPVRAAMVEQPESYRWCTLGYLIQSKNKDSFLSLEFGVERLNKLAFEDRLKAYREFVYEIGALVSKKGKSIDPKILEKHRQKGFAISSIDRLKYRTRYFTDSGVIGSKMYVQQIYQQFLDYFDHKKEKKPVPIQGMDAVFSLKRLILE
jgi:putative transposase